MTSGPKGPIDLPDPSHLKPESDWPAAAWYDFTMKLTEGKEAGVTVIDHPKNPPSLWHNNRGLRMLNPCVTAPDEVTLKANERLVLRYRVVVHDGAVASKQVDVLSQEWRKE